MWVSSRSHHADACDKGDSARHTYGEDIELEPDSHLGAGACGVVLKGVIKHSGIPVAVKTVKVDDKAKREQLLNEIRGLIAADGCVNLVHWYAG
ncbi:unnamed protein product, partial [Effrenium voratum]